MVFHTEFCEFRELRNFEDLKKKSFSSGQEVVQIKQNSVLNITIVITVYSQKVVGIACLGKKWFFMRNFANFANCELLRILKKFFFFGSRSCPNQTKLGIEYHQCNDSVKQKSCWYSLPRKKMVFHTEFCEFRELRIFENFKKNLFHRVKELSKSNQTRYWVSRV